MAHYCENCARNFSNPRCPRCGGLPANIPRSVEAPVSVAEDILDSMVEEASRPTLATLLKRGIKSGQIKPAHEYTNGLKP